jgi:uncharacterized membrane protein YphA (DoxX/SURF4 family)
MIPQLKTETPVSAPEITSQWSPVTKLAFRFTFVYFLLYMTPRPLGSLSAGLKAGTVVDTVWHSVVPWFGQNVLRISGDFSEAATGSGDRLYDYVLLSIIVIVAAIATVVWSWLDRKRPNYEVLYQWLRIVVRVSLAITLMGYGCNKIFRSQFYAPSLMRLVEPYGQGTPMDLLWAFMGYSRGYSFFGGVGEMVASFCLLVPQLTTLGALVGGAVMTNVLMLNLAYDVPRKILSFHLILMCLFLLAPDLRRMFDFFVLNRQAQLHEPVYAFKDKFLGRGLTVLVLVIGVSTLIGHSIWSYHSAKKGEDLLPSAVRGVWMVDQLAVDGIVQPPVVADSQRWRSLILDTEVWTSIQFMNDSHRMYLSKVDTGKKNIVLWLERHPDRKDTLTYELPQPDKMILEGALDGHQVSAKLTRIPLSDPVIFQLTNRGFHWINTTTEWHPE